MTHVRAVVGCRPAAVVLSMAVMCAVGAAPGARASGYGIELNGTYLATSNGQWAKTNDSYHDEPVVRSVWTMSSSCTRITRCEGRVTSDQGWSARLVLTEDRWVVSRDIPAWAPCQDGSRADGHQKFIFYGVSGLGTIEATNTDLLGGRDNTRTDSGACGRNQPLVVEMPLRLERQS